MRSVAKMRGLVGLVTALVLSLSTLCPAAVFAASFETLPDGRIAFVALGEKFVFREQDLENVDLVWMDYPCTPKPLRISLALWRSDRQVAACLKEIFPDTYPRGSLSTLTLRIKLKFEDGTRYPEPGRKITDPVETTSSLSPGNVPPADLPTPLRLLDFMYVGVLQHTDSYRAPDMPTDGPADDLGYQKYHAGEPGEFYRLLADRRIGKASRPLDIACGSYCSVSIVSSDGHVGLRLEWMGPSPRSGWSKYDAAARKIADSIFAARAAGDLQ